MATPTLDEAVETFPERVLAAVLIGENGAERVWLHADIATPDQHAWAARHLQRAVTIAQTMQSGVGRG